MENPKKIWVDWKLLAIPWIIFLSALVLPGDREIWVQLGIIAIFVYAWILALWMAVYAVKINIINFKKGMKRLKNRKWIWVTAKRRWYFERGKLILEKIMIKKELE
jgi:hypothetical protein